MPGINLQAITFPLPQELERRLTLHFGSGVVREALYERLLHNCGKRLNGVQIAVESWDASGILESIAPISDPLLMAKQVIWAIVGNNDDEVKACAEALTDTLNRMSHRE